MIKYLIILFSIFTLSGCGTWADKKPAPEVIPDTTAVVDTLSFLTDPAK